MFKNSLIALKSLRSSRVLLAAALLSLPAFAQGPCDIYAKAGTPCVAAHSTTRALYDTFSGPLYQVLDTTNNKTKDIYPIVRGGVANKSSQDSFFNGKVGKISIIYDQSPQKNHLPKSPKCTYLSVGKEASSSQGITKLDGHDVVGIYIVGAAAESWAPNGIPGVAYRNNNTKGVATGNQAESMYMVVDGKRYSNACCFDYGNGETTGHDDGNGTMEAIYWGTNITWGGKGEGSGPWIAADLENGMFKANQGGQGSSNQSYTNDKTINATYASLFLKGPAADTFGMKAGDAQTGKLTTMWNGPRPTPNYYPKKLQGAIFLGTGGDGSPGGTGTFYEGVMTIGNPPDSIDDKVQANIVAAGYGRTTSSVRPRPANETTVRLVYLSSGSVASFEYANTVGTQTELQISDIRGSRVATIHQGPVAPGNHRAVWDASKSRSGLYLVKLVEDGHTAWAGNVLIGK